MKTRNTLASAALFDTAEKKDDVFGRACACKKNTASVYGIIKVIISIFFVYAYSYTACAQKQSAPVFNIVSTYPSLFTTGIAYPVSSANTDSLLNHAIKNTGKPHFYAPNDIAVTISVNNPSATAGSNVLFKITAKNNGPGIANNIIVSEILPDGYTYVAYTATGGAYNIVNGEWDIENIAAGDSETLTIIATVRATGLYQNTVSIWATEPDPDLTNNSASVTVTPSVGLPVFTSGPGSSRCQGSGTVAYSASASNTTGITYSLSPISAGSVDATTGEVIWNISFSGTATISASAAGNNGPTVSQHVVTVNPLPTASISYGGIPYCKSGNVAVILTGQTGGAFSAGAGLSINASTGEINLGTSTPGTYTVTYDFSNGSCNGSTGTTIVINDIPAVTVTDPSFVCSPFTINITLPGITAGSSAGLTYTYFADEEASTPLTNANAIGEPGIYYIKGTNAAGCSDIKPVHADIKSIAATLTSSSGTAIGGSNFTLTTNADVDYEISSWAPAAHFPDQTAKTQSTALKDSSTTFTIIAVSEDGCKDTASVRVNLAGNVKDLFIPNAFTPNRDGKNDVFKVYGTTVTGAEIRIYTQWGALIYETNDNTKGWDGTSKGVPQPVGPYIYVVKVRTNDQDTFLKKGTINLIR